MDFITNILRVITLDNSITELQSICISVFFIMLTVVVSLVVSFFRKGGSK